jgi:hypothetical protein
VAVASARLRICLATLSNWECLILSSVHLLLQPTYASCYTAPVPRFPQHHTTMSFSFGAPQPAGAAPAGGGFSFGAPAGAAPAPSAFSFGAPATPAAPASFSFGAPAAPAPSLWGAAPPSAPSPFASSFGAAAPVAPPPQQWVDKNTLYSQLPAQYKQAIDQLHDLMMNHERAINQVRVLAPRALQKDAVSNQCLITRELSKLSADVNALDKQLLSNHSTAKALLADHETATVRAVMYGKYPIEGVARRRGVLLPDKKENVASTSNQASSSQDDATAAATTQRIQQLLDRQLMYIDHVQKVPSPFLWQMVEEYDKQIQSLQDRVQSLENQILNYDKTKGEMDVVYTIAQQHQRIHELIQVISQLSQHVEKMKLSYSYYESSLGSSSGNVLDQNRLKQFQEQQQHQHRLQSLYLQQQSAATAPATAAPGSAQQTASGGLFGAAPSPGLFSSAPASAGGLFASPTPAPGGLFGPSPSTSNLFASSTPAPGGLFSSTNAPAPATGGLFGPAPTSTGFGPAPQPAPAGAGLFTATAPAPTGGGLFGPPASQPGVTTLPTFSSSTTSTARTPKKKTGPRSTRYGR